MIYTKAFFLFLWIGCGKVTCELAAADSETSILSLTSEINDIARLCKVRTGRDSKLAQVTVPLIAGFKFTGLLISAFTAIKIFLLQSLFISKLAFIVSFILVAKVVFDNLKKASIKFPEFETKVVDYYPYGNSFIDYQELPVQVPGVEMDYSKFHSQDHEDMQTLHSNNYLSMAPIQPRFNTTGIINRRTEDAIQSSVPLVIGYESYVKRIIKEVTN